MESLNTRITGGQGAVGMKEQEGSRALLTLWGDLGQQRSEHETDKSEEALVCGESCQIWCEIFVHSSTSFSRHSTRPCGGKKDA